MGRPFGLRFASWYLLSMGLLMVATSGMSDDEPVSLTARLLWIGSGVIAVIGGIGLLRVTRWGWAVGLACALGASGFGGYAVLAAGLDITLIGAYVGVLLMLLFPGLLLFCVLVSPRTIRWFRLRGIATTPNRPDPPA